MMRMRMNWIKLDFINKSAVIRKLYGNSTSTDTSRFYKKMNRTHGQRFLEHELERLEEIRKEIIKELNK